MTALPMTKPESRPSLLAIAQTLGQQFARHAAKADEEDCFVADNYAALKTSGLVEAGVPAELGGGGAELAELADMLRILAHHCSSTALAFSMHTHQVAIPAWRWKTQKVAAVEPLLRRIAAEKLVLLSSGDAALVCTAVLPCPAEMGASIHISGTGSSILDSVFVCRATGRIPPQSLRMRPDDVARYVHADIASLQDAGVRLHAGDVRCLTYGHLTRLCVWALRGDWSPQSSVTQALDRVGLWFGGAASFEEVLEILKELAQGEPSPEGFMNMLHSGGTGVRRDAVSF